MQGSWWQEGPVEAQCFTERSQFEMISFSVDPQWCGLLFSLYCRHEKGALLGGGAFLQADPFAACSVAGPPLDTDWIALAGSISFEVCRLSSTWAVIFDSGEMQNKHALYTTIFNIDLVVIHSDSDILRHC